MYSSEKGKKPHTNTDTEKVENNLNISTEYMACKRPKQRLLDWGKEFGTENKETASVTQDLCVQGN